MAEVVEKSKKEDSSVLAIAKVEAKSDRPSNLCCYSQRTCNLEKLKGFDFCHKHILEDKASPFKPCDFVAKSNGRRCPNPAPKLPDRGKSFCIIHTRKAELRRAVEERRKRRHHKGDGDESYDGNKDKRRRTSSSNSQKIDKLDGHSSDEEGGASGDDYLKVDSAWHGDIDSDADSVDSEEEDPLKHAGVWTVEETTRMCRDKMIRLRSLYIAQFKRLQHVLKERKRKYCQAIQAEEEEETGECHLTPTQLLGHKRQHERPGTEALLHKQAKEKKQGTSPRQQAVSTLRCTYSPGGIRCTEKVLPLTKHCIKHITHDPNQLLFQKCAFQCKGDSLCDRNVAKVFNHTSCRLHLELPASMKRPDVRKDLQDARERAELRKARALEQKDKPDVPETLEQKSSALVPPSITGQTEETATTTSEPQLDMTSTPSDSLSAAPEKMEIDNNDVTCKSDGECKLSTNSANASSSSASSSGVAVSAPAPALESISPGLAAASLVAVCSSPQVPLQGTPLASIRDIKQLSVTDLKPLPATSSEQQSISNAPCDDAKGDVGSKLPEVTGGESSKETKEATAVDPKNTLSAPQEMTERVSRSPNGNNTTAVQSERPGSAVKQPEETKAKLHVDKDKDEVKVPISASQCASQTAAQGTSQVVASQGTSSTFPKVISPTAKLVPQNLSVDSKQITSKSASQGTSNTSKVISPTAKISPQDLSENSKLVTSKSASQGIPNTSKVTLPTSIKATPQESSEIPSKVTSKSAWHVTSNVSPKVTSAATKFAPRESSEDSSQVASKSAMHVTSNVSLKVTFATTKVVPRESPEDSSQVAPKSTLQGSSKGVLHEAHKATSQGTLPAPHSVPKQPSLVASGVHPPQPTATNSTTSQPSKPNPAKPHMTSDTPRSTSVKLFQHLPAGMTSSSSKQFSAITSVLSKETNKDSKTDVAKPKDQGNPAKL